MLSKTPLVTPKPVGMISKLSVTSSQAGYKIPTSPADLLSFARHAETVCFPMLGRLRSACNAIRLATLGSVDVLGAPELAQLRRLVEAVDDAAEGNGS